MQEVSYRPLIEDMKWSYSRLKTYDDCPYRFFLSYIRKCNSVDMFYSSYGQFIHKLIERYYRGELEKNEMLIEYLSKFSSSVKGERPKESIVQKYIKSGAEYVKNFQPFEYKMLAVEKRVDFWIGGDRFIGYIDYIGKDDDELCIIDHKSRELKPRSRRSKPTLKDQELDEMLKQLYIYSAAVKQECGKFPKALCFNCFRSGTFIKEPFNEKTYVETIIWAKQKIEEIKNCEDFYPKINFFVCNNICGYNKSCCYSQA